MPYLWSPQSEIEVSIHTAGRVPIPAESIHTAGRLYRFSRYRHTAGRECKLNELKFIYYANILWIVHVLNMCFVSESCLPLLP